MAVNNANQEQKIPEVAKLKKLPENDVCYHLIAPGKESNLYPALPLGWCRVYSLGAASHKYCRRAIVRIIRHEASVLRQISYGRNICKDECHLDYDAIIELAPDGKDSSGELRTCLRFKQANLWERHIMFYMNHPDSTIAAAYRIAFASVVVGLVSVVLAILTILWNKP